MESKNVWIIVGILFSLAAVCNVIAYVCQKRIKAKNVSSWPI